MRLVDKQRPDIVVETLTDDEAAALRQWFEGSADDEQERLVHGVLRSAKAREFWIECDCVGALGTAPLSAPVLANGVYTIRRLVGTELTGVGSRPNHRHTCPLHYGEEQFRERIGTTYVERSHVMPTGPVDGLPRLSGALADRRLRPCSSSERYRDAAPLPATAVSLWRLLHLAQLNVIQPDQDFDHATLSSALARLRTAAARITVSHDLPWSAVLSTYPGDLRDPASRWRRSFQKVASRWRRDERATAAMLAAAPDVAQFAVGTFRHGEIEVRSLVRKPVRGDPAGRGPYLTLVLFGVDDDTGELVAEKAYAQPVASLDTLFPVESGFERDLLTQMLVARRWLHANDPMVRLQVAKPLFDLMTEEGPCRPDFLINAWTDDDPRPRRLIVEARGMATERYRQAKALTIPRMRRVAPVHEILHAEFRRAPEAFTAWFVEPCRIGRGRLPRDPERRPFRPHHRRRDLGSFSHYRYSENDGS